MKTAFGLPPASKVTVPVRPTEDAELYTPGDRVCPPRSAEIGEVGPSPAATLYAVTSASFAPCVIASPAWFVPLIVRLPVPVSVVVGNVPTSPSIVVGPVLETPAPASTPKLEAVPSGTAVAAAWAVPVIPAISPTDVAVLMTTNNTAPRRTRLVPRRCPIILDPSLSLELHSPTKMSAASGAGAWC